MCIVHLYIHITYILGMSISCLRIFGPAILLKTIESSHMGLLLRTISNLIFLAEQRICMPMFQAAAIFLVRSTHIDHIS